MVILQIFFDAPKGDDPVALNLSSMGKGEAWVNGQSIGRYWISFHDYQGNSPQILYVTISYISTVAFYVKIINKHQTWKKNKNKNKKQCAYIHTQESEFPKKIFVKGD